MLPVVTYRNGNISGSLTRIDSITGYADNGISPIFFDQTDKGKFAIVIDVGEILLKKPTRRCPSLCKMGRRNTSLPFLRVIHSSYWEG
jgi:hypothetical protein